VEDKLKNTGFVGDLEWIFNQEGSGARFYKSSVYFPDNISNPTTNSGITIDPGVDIGNCDRATTLAVINFYQEEELLSASLKSLLLTAIGKKGRSAAAWMTEHRKFFKNIFIAPIHLSIQVLQYYTAPVYWKPLEEAMPDLLTISNPSIKKAVHTALLSMAYNRGCTKTIALARNWITRHDFGNLAESIEEVKSCSPALTDRRKDESLLIKAAMALGDRFTINIKDLNPRPLTTITTEDTEDYLLTHMPEVLV
jgi:hypothetical protein